MERKRISYMRLGMKARRECPAIGPAPPVVVQSKIFVIFFGVACGSVHGWVIVELSINVIVIYCNNKLFTVNSGG